MFLAVDNHPEVYISTNQGASMGDVEYSREAVEAQLSALEERYQSFSINQTTLSVSPDRYERECQAWDEHSISVYARVFNDEGNILQLDEPASLPSTTTNDMTSVETAAKQAVLNAADMECSIETLHEATILGIHNAEKPESDTLYTLAVVFEASAEETPTSDNVTWADSSDNWLSV